MSSRNSPAASSLAAGAAPGEANVALLGVVGDACVAVDHVRVRVQPEPQNTCSRDGRTRSSSRRLNGCRTSPGRRWGDRLVERKVVEGVQLRLLASARLHGGDPVPSRWSRGLAPRRSRRFATFARARAVEWARRARDRADADRCARGARAPAGRSRPTSPCPRRRRRRRGRVGLLLAVAPLVGVPRLVGAVPAIRAALDV
jgi:hypothetical protein